MRGGGGGGGVDHAREIAGKKKKLINENKIPAVTVPA